MEIPPDTEFESYVARAKIFCMVDAKMDFVISSIIENQFVDEITLALRHLNDVKNKINMNKVITCYDRFYNVLAVPVRCVLLPVSSFLSSLCIPYSPFRF